MKKRTPMKKEHEIEEKIMPGIHKKVKKIEKKKEEKRTKMHMKHHKDCGCK